MKYLVSSLLICGVLLLIACGSKGPDAPNTVHMSISSFSKSSITIKQGESVTLSSDTFTQHVISNGTWDGDSPKGGKESGAPAVDDVKIDGNGTATIGPFSIAGTYKLYCTLHPGMVLTVIVQ